MGCLYRISFPNGMAYIGITAAATPEKRFRAHLYEAGKGTRGALYNTIRAYGPDAAEVEWLGVAEGWPALCAMERAAIVEYGTRSPRGLNMTDGGDGAPIGHEYRIGLKHSDEAKAKMAAAKRGVPRSAAAKAAVSTSLLGNTRNLGRRATSETRARISAANTGRQWSEEAKARMSIAALKREAERRARST